jgi:SAM-dependent methyltransferase
MGTSNWQNISYCIELIRRMNPQRILDVGVGFGRWGILSREFLEVWNQKIYSKDWDLQIDGIEIFEPNIEEYHKYFYSNIFKADAASFVKNIKDNYDLIIIGDMLEHLEKEKGLEFLSDCLCKTKYLLLNIPIGGKWEQDELYGNKYERHLSTWKLRDFKPFNIITKKFFRDYIYRRFAVLILSYKENDLPPDSKLYASLRFYLLKYMKKQ